MKNAHSLTAQAKPKPPKSKSVHIFWSNPAVTAVVAKFSSRLRVALKQEVNCGVDGSDTSVLLVTILTILYCLHFSIILYLKKKYLELEICVDGHHNLRPSEN